MTAPPAVFLSHSHQDKGAARRLAGELRPYAFPVWIDEAELRFGAQLGATLQARIEESDVVVVVASAASARSTWVALEIRYAQEHGKPIVPLYIESIMDVEPFADLFGVHAIARTGSVTAAQTLMSQRSVGRVRASAPSPATSPPRRRAESPRRERWVVARVTSRLRWAARAPPRSRARPMVRRWLRGVPVGRPQTAHLEFITWAVIAGPNSPHLISW
jgi:hypothetical protein